MEDEKKEPEGPPPQDTVEPKKELPPMGQPEFKALIMKDGKIIKDGKTRKK